MQAYVTALYGRTSKDDVKRVPIEGQKDLLRKWSAADDGVASVAGEYWDVGVSGKIPLAQRPAGKRLLADIASGHIKAVAVARVDRFGRTLLDGLQAAAELEKQGVKLVSVGEQWDARRGDSRLNFNLRLLIAEEDHKRIRDNMEGGKERAMEEDNAPPGGPLTFGYRFDTQGRFEVDPVESAIVIECYAMYLRGVTITEILAWIKTQNVPAGRRVQCRGQGSVARVVKGHEGCKWKNNQVRRILTNPTYLGQRSWGKRVFPCVPLIDPDTFARVDALLIKNRGKYRRKGTSVDRLCSGLFSCQSCGSLFYFHPRHCRRSNGQVDHYAYYLCAGISRGVDCHAKMINADAMDNQVWKTVESYLVNPEAIISSSLAADDVLRREVSDYEREEAVLLATQSGLDARVAEIWQEQTRNNWPTSWVVPQVNACNVERETVLASLKKTRQSRAAALVNRDSSLDVIAFLAGYRANLTEGMTPEKKKEVIRRLVKGGVITTTNEGGKKGATLTLQLRWGEFVSGQVPKDSYHDSQPDATLPVVLTFPPRVADRSARKCLLT